MRGKGIQDITFLFILMTNIKNQGNKKNWRSLLFQDSPLGGYNGAINRDRGNLQGVRQGLRKAEQELLLLPPRPGLQLCSNEPLSSLLLHYCL